MALKTAIIRTTAAAVLTAVTIIGGTSAGVAGELTRDGSAQTIETTTIFELENELSAPLRETEEVVLADFTPEQAPLLEASGSSSLTGGRTTLGDSRFDAADDFKAGPGCSIQCITSGRAYARGVGVKLVVKTDTPADVAITVWDGDGYYRVVESDGQTTQFEALLDDLDPHTEYQAAVTAEDGQGYVSEASGHFETLTRNVEISFNSATINAAPYGNDFYYLDLWAEGEWLYDTAGPIDPEGDTLPLGIHFITLEDMDRYLDFAIQLTQYNEGPTNCEVTYPLESPTIGSEQAACKTYAYAAELLGYTDLDARPADASSWTEHSFVHMLAIPFGYNSALDFSVAVTFNVTYE